MLTKNCILCGQTMYKHRSLLSPVGWHYFKTSSDVITVTTQRTSKFQFLLRSSCPNLCHIVGFYTSDLFADAVPEMPTLPLLAGD